MLAFSCLQAGTYSIGSRGSPACTLQVLGLLSLHNHTSQFLIINLFLHTHTHFLLALFLRRTLTNTSFRKLFDSGANRRLFSHFLYSLKNDPSALAGVAQWIKHQPVNQKVIGSITSQETCLGCGPGTVLGVCKRQPIHVSLTH